MFDSKKNIKATCKTIQRGFPSKTYAIVDTTYKKSLRKLSYKQLLRISSAVSASTENEKLASKLFFKSLTPFENSVVKAIRNSTSPSNMERKKKMLFLQLHEKNKAEIADVNIDALLSEVKSDHRI